MSGNVFKSYEYLTVKWEYPNSSPSSLPSFFACNDGIGCRSGNQVVGRCQIRGEKSTVSTDKEAVCTVHCSADQDYASNQKLHLTRKISKPFGNRKNRSCMLECSMLECSFGLRCFSFYGFSFHLIWLLLFSASKMDGVSPLPDESPSLVPSSSESFHMSMYLAPSHHMSMASESSRQVFQWMIWSDIATSLLFSKEPYNYLKGYELKCHKILFVVHFISPFFVHHQDGVRGEHV